PDVAGNASRGLDVVVTAHLADVLAPGPDTDEGRCRGIGDDLLRLLDVDDDLRADGDRGSEGRQGGGRPQRRLELVPRLHPVVVSAVEQADVFDAAVREDECGAGGGDLARAAARAHRLRPSL